MRAGLERTSLLFGVFVSGAVLLGVEIAASRVVAPYFGSSLYVWGAVIGVVLTGLAVGYWGGGALADRYPSIQLLLAVMALGALLVLAIPYVDDRVLQWIVEQDFGARMNPLVAAVALFGPMSVVLAAVTPVAVRIAAHSVLTLGRTAGRLFAVSTFGSIFGTFATAFVLIPELGTNQLLALCAAILLGGTALVALARMLPIAAALGAAAAVGAAFLSASLAPEQGGTLTAAAAQNYSPIYRLREDEEASDAVDYAAEGYRVRFRRNSAYHSIAVVEDDQTRYLRFDSSFQSAMELQRPFVSPFAYLDYLQLGFAYRPSARDVLIVGLGGGSAPKRFWRDYPDVRIQAVELDPVVVDVARRWFGLPEDDRLGVEVDDGRQYLQKTDERWDVIILDAYYADSLPFHLTTQEFMTLVRSRLKPGGVVVANIIGSVAGANSKLFRSFYRTYRSVFPSVAVWPVDLSGDAEALRNIIVVAANAALPSVDVLRDRWDEIRGEHPQAPTLDHIWSSNWTRFVPTRDVPVLTDDYAPTDALILVD